MRQRIWVLALIVSIGLACARDETPEAQRQAIPASETPYRLEVRFEGLVGYVNTKDAVWALLPKAHRAAMPPGVDPGSSVSFYPEHFAVLKVEGASVNGIPAELRISIEGYEIELEKSFFGGTGSGLPADPFKQDPGDAAVEVLTSDVLGATPPQSLAARMKLPLGDSTEWSLELGDKKFLRVNPKPKSGNYCDDADVVSTGARTARVENVVWKKENLTGNRTLILRPLGGTDEFPLVLTPAEGQKTVKVSILNQVGESLYNKTHDPHHWTAYRWYYSLSKEQSDCEKHYYPQGDAGGNRCPQKLYSE